MTMATTEGGLVDLHCHLLPGVDDGPAELAGSLAMARQAAEGGIGVICATPHIRADHHVVIGELAARVEDLQRAIDAEGIPVRVRTGGEVAAPLAAALDAQERRAVSLGGTGVWMLVEPRPGPMDDALVETVERLHDDGLRCVIAHPERHAGADAAVQLGRLVERGALVQVTAALVADGPAAPTILEWAQAGLVHLVASDAHAANVGRPVALAAGLARLGTSPRVAPHLDWIAHVAPAAILAGQQMSAPF